MSKSQLVAQMLTSAPAVNKDKKEKLSLSARFEHYKRNAKLECKAVRALYKTPEMKNVVYTRVVDALIK